jgi:hypothetical protein
MLESLLNLISGDGGDAQFEYGICKLFVESLCAEIFMKRAIEIWLVIEVSFCFFSFII